MRRGRKLLLEDDQKFFLVHTTHPLARGASRRGEERRGAAVIIKARRTGREGKKWQGGRKEKRNDEIATLAGSVAPLSSLCSALASPRPSRSPLFAHRETALKLSMERRGRKKERKKEKRTEVASVGRDGGVGPGGWNDVSPWRPKLSRPDFITKSYNRPSETHSFSSSFYSFIYLFLYFFLLSLSLSISSPLLVRSFFARPRPLLYSLFRLFLSSSRR